MKLAPGDCRTRLEAHDHGVLCTLHAERGVDVVPVVYVLDSDDHVGIPVDTVKPKQSLRLQRERNLESDPRAALLIELWDRHDWSRLWWVRAELRWVPEPRPDRAAALAGQLSERYEQYRQLPFARVLVLRVVALSGWAASSR